MYHLQQKIQNFLSTEIESTFLSFFGLLSTTVKRVRLFKSNDMIFHELRKTIN